MRPLTRRQKAIRQALKRLWKVERGDDFIFSGSYAPGNLRINFTTPVNIRSLEVYVDGVPGRFYVNSKRSITVRLPRNGPHRPEVNVVAMGLGDPGTIKTRLALWPT